MITGKDACREQFARVAIQNFENQTYPRQQRRLLIINHGSYSLIAPNAHRNPNANIYEFHVNKSKDTSLGKLRNIALELVPFNSYWITWDDDDYQSPNFLETFNNARIKHNVDCVFVQNRIEHNINTHYTWQMTLKSGFVFALLPKDARFQYEDVNSMEDLKLPTFYKSNYSHTIVDNDPKIYVRFVHKANTSLYVNPKKDNVQSTPILSNYIESSASTDNIEYTDKIISSFYKQISEECAPFQSKNT